MQKNTDFKNTNPLGGFLIYLFSILLSVVVTFYLGYHFLSSFGNELSTEYALQITENDVREFDAYILRNETVVYSSGSGGIGYTFSDGTKVGTGDAVANIYGSSADANDAAREEIIALDREIELLYESNSTEGLAISDTQTIDKRIDNYYMTIRESAEQGVYSSLPKRRDELLTLLNKRQIITGKIQGFDGVIEDLISKREYLTAGLDTVSETVSATASGYFYSSLDGYESIFTAESVKTMTLEQFDSMMRSEPESYPINAIGKIATDFRWYIIIEASREELRYYNEGYNYKVIFPYNNDTELKMNLSQVIAPDGGQRILLIFSSHEIPEDFSYKRMQTVEIVRSTHTGYRVPISAVRLVDGRMGVYILIGTTVEFRYIDVILECDGYYIVAPRDIQNDENAAEKLGLYDVIITGGRDLYVGKIIT